MLTFELRVPAVGTIRTARWTAIYADLGDLLIIARLPRANRLENLKVNEFEARDDIFMHDAAGNYRTILFEKSRKSPEKILWKRTKVGNLDERG